MNEEANKRLGNLIFSLAHGNIAALADIYMLMVKILYAVGNIYFTQRADIEDAIQDLLILLYDNAHKFKRNKNACAWIIKLYQNMIYKNLKKRKSEDNYISEQIQLQNITSLEDNSKYIENYLFFNEIFDKLDKYEQDLVIYRCVGKCSIKEVTDILGKPKSTVESQLKKLENKIKNI